MSKDLQSEFPGTQGYSVQNLWYMRQLYIEYRGNPKLQPMVGEIGCSHNIVVMSKFKPEYAGKMNFYLSVLNDKIRLEDESPSIGIIVCKEKNRTTVEYALNELNQPIGIASYRVTTTLSQDYKCLLPTPETIIESITNIVSKTSIGGH